MFRAINALMISSTPGEYYWSIGGKGTHCSIQSRIKMALRSITQRYNWETLPFLFGLLRGRFDDTAGAKEISLGFRWMTFVISIGLCFHMLAKFSTLLSYFKVSNPIFAGSPIVDEAFGSTAYLISPAYGAPWYSKPYSLSPCFSQ
jgi:hypothetical protein